MVVAPMQGIEEEHGYFFVGNTILSILKVLDSVRQGMSEDDIQQRFRLTDQQLAESLAFIRVNQAELGARYTEEIQRFTRDARDQLRGLHRPALRIRAGALLLIGAGLALAVFLRATWQGSGDEIAALGMAIMCVLIGSVSEYTTFRQVVHFQDQALVVRHAYPRKSFILPYVALARIKVSVGYHNTQHLLVQDTAQQWRELPCTQSMKTVIWQLAQSERYDPALHYDSAA